MPELAERTPRLHHVDNVGPQLGLGRSKVYELIASGELRSVKVGRRRLVPESAIVEFVARLEAAGVA